MVAFIYATLIEDRIDSQQLLFDLKGFHGFAGLGICTMGQRKSQLSEIRRLFAAWVQQHAKSHGLSDSALAEALGVSQPSFNKLKNGNRTAKFEEAAILSQIFSAELPTQMKLATQEPVRKVIALRENVAANVWRRNENHMSTAQLSVLQFSNEKYDGLEQFAHFVDDEHANGYVSKNFYIICVNYFDVRGAPLQGDMVLVERTRFFTPEEGGDLVERSIRKLTKKGDGWLLEAINPDRSRYPDIHYEGETPGLKITGLIIGRYAPD
jgi:predicted XRE-type DNA-binding protein